MIRQKGFTLIELLVVIAIIGLLSTLAVVSLNSARAKARDARRTSDIRQVQTALEMYFNDASEYPKTDTGGLTLGTGDGSVICYDADDVTAPIGFHATPSACDTTMMNQVPSDPQTSENYSYGDNNSDPSTYSITFTLENTNAAWGGVNCTASPGRIICTPS